MKNDNRNVYRQEDLASLLEEDSLYRALESAENEANKCERVHTAKVLKEYKHARVRKLVGL